MIRRSCCKDLCGRMNLGVSGLRRRAGCRTNRSDVIGSQTLRVACGRFTLTTGSMPVPPPDHKGRSAAPSPNHIGSKVIKVGVPMSRKLLGPFIKGGISGQNRHRDHNDHAIGFQAKPQAVGQKRRQKIIQACVNRLVGARNPIRPPNLGNTSARQVSQHKRRNEAKKEQ